MNSTEINKTANTSSRVNHQNAQSAFLAAYAQCGNITRAAETAGISRSTLRVWLKEDERYRKAFELAEEVLIGRLEEEVWRRAMEGEEKPVFYKGVQCGTVRCNSNSLLIMLLQALKPEKYGKRVCNNDSSMGDLYIILEP